MQCRGDRSRDNEGGLKVSEMRRKEILELQTGDASPIQGDGITTERKSETITLGIRNGLAGFCLMTALECKVSGHPIIYSGDTSEHRSSPKSFTQEATSGHGVFTRLMPAINPLAMHDRSDLSIRLHGDGAGRERRSPLLIFPCPHGLILRFISVIGAEMVAFYRYLGILISLLYSAKIIRSEVLVGLRPTLSSKVIKYRGISFHLLRADRK